MAGDTLYVFSPTPTSVCIPFAGSTVTQACSFPLDTRRSRVQQRRSCHPITPPPSTTPRPGRQHAMSAKAPSAAMQSVISRVVPNVKVRDVQPLPSLHSQRLYDVQVSDGSSLFLALPPPLMVKLLRSEQGSISSEAAVLRWLKELGIDGPMLTESASSQNDASSSPRGKALARSRPSQDGPSLQLGAFLPTLLAHSAASNEFGIEYNVLRPTSGVPIADIKPPLSSAERRMVELQTGQFSRRLSKLTSPTGRFGPAFAVLPSWSAPTPNTSSSAASRDANARMTESKGTLCWSMAFHSMLEAVLRDGEDMAVMLGYAAIRRHFQQWSHTLDNVVTPRLVAVDAGFEPNTLVIRREPSARDRRASSSDGTSDSDGPGSSGSGAADNDTHSEVEDMPPTVEMTGMKDWSNFIFGDPLFATIFSSEPSDEFLRGFNNTIDGEAHDEEEPASLIDDEGSMHIRLLLYSCYHTITQIVKEFYRPQRDSGLRELAARKRLTHIMGKLGDMREEALGTDELRSTPSPRRRNTGEPSPAKKTKSDTD